MLLRDYSVTRWSVCTHIITVVKFGKNLQLKKIRNHIFLLVFSTQIYVRSVPSLSYFVSQVFLSFFSSVWES